MEQKIAGERFEKRAAQAIGPDTSAAGRAPNGERGTDSLFSALAAAMTVGPAVAFAEFILVLLVGALAAGELPSAADLGKLILVLPGTLILAYVFALVPATIGALVMYPVVRLRLPTVLEYMAAGLIGGMVLEFVVFGFHPAGVFAFTGVGLAGVLPALASLHVYRRRVASAGRISVSWKRRDPRASPNSH
jgi:hypothetical protein